MNLGSLELNPGAQTAFVLGEEKFSAFIGGLGSGKTYAGVLRGLKFALQPKPDGVFHPPHGMICAVSYPALRDVIIPKLEEICYRTGVADFERDYKKSSMTLTLKNGALIRLRSLDKPDNIVRGPEYTWAFIDEGRNISLHDFKLVTGRLRQEGYKRGAFVASTPNGYDWMYHVFNPEGDHRKEYPDANWYNAPMRENIHLDNDYLDEMEVSYSGRWYEQEVLGRFVGLVEGGVFPEWDPSKFLVPLQYDKTLPLYAGWDFGIGDPGVCVFYQVRWVPVDSGDERKIVFLPEVDVLDILEAKDLAAKDWAELYTTHLSDFYGGPHVRGYGDPAGTARQPGSGTSVIDDLRAAGVDLTAAPKRPQDYSIRILSNMMAGGRLKVNETAARRVSDALSSHKWNLDDNSVRIGVNPVHDWTSHIVDALRYGVSMIPMRPKLEYTPEEDAPGPSTYGHVFDQLVQRKAQKGVRAPQKPIFVPPTISTAKEA